MNFKLGYRNTLRHEVTAAVILRVLEAYGIETDTATGNDQELATQMKAGFLDMVVSLWMPELDSTLYSVSAGELIGDLYQASLGVFSSKENSDNQCETLVNIKGGTLFAVEEYMPAAKNFLEKYAITPAQLALHPLPERDIQFVVNMGKEAGHYYLLPEGSFLASKAGIPLKDSRSVLPALQTAQLLLYPAARKTFDSDLFDELEGLLLGQKVLFALEEAVVMKGMTPAEAAEAWQRGKLIGR